MEQKTEQQMREEPRAANDNRERPAPVFVRTARVVKAPSIGEKIRGAQLSKKGGLGLMFVGAVLAMIVGFNWGGWVTGGTAVDRASSKAQDAVLLRLTPICVAQFNLDPQRGMKLDELKAITSSWERPGYVEKQGWATMPGEKAPDRDVASACSKLLIEG